MSEKGNIIIWASIILMVLALSAMLVITTATLGLNMRKDDEKIKQAIYLVEGMADVDYTLLADELLKGKEYASNKADTNQEFSEHFKDYFNQNKNQIESKLKNKENYTKLIDEESKVQVTINERMKWINSSKDYLIPLKIKVIHKNVTKVIKVNFIISIPDYNTSNEELINFIVIENYRYDDNEN